MTKTRWLRSRPARGVAGLAWTATACFLVACGSSPPSLGTDASGAGQGDGVPVPSNPDASTDHDVAVGAPEGRPEIADSTHPDAEGTDAREDARIGDVLPAAADVRSEADRDAGGGPIPDGSAAEAAAGVLPYRLAHGDDHVCAWRPEGDLYCWGRNEEGELGIGRQLQWSTAVKVQDLPGSPKDVAAGSGHTCAVMGTGAVYCWGKNDYGQLGDGTTEPRRLLPTRIPDLSNAVAVAAGVVHTCALRGDGTVYCWGRGDSGQLGNGSLIVRRSPRKVEGLGDAVKLSAGSHHTCALRRAGQVACWGDSGYGDRNNGSVVPIDMLALSGAVIDDVVSGPGHACAHTTEGKWYCWGKNGSGELGSGGGKDSSLPVLLDWPVAEPVLEIAASSAIYARTVGGRVLCWGPGGLGKLGDTSPSSGPRPRLVPSLTDVTSLAGSCAVRASGIVCWGVNYHGQIGDGTRAASNEPVSVIGLPENPGSTDGGVPPAADAGTDALAGACLGSGPGCDRVIDVAAGGSHACALLASGRIRCWGDNRFGQLGRPAGAPIFRPVEVPGLSDVLQISAAGHTCAVRADHSLVCWGGNDYNGVLGDGTTSPRAEPKPVTGLGEVEEVAASVYHTCARTRAGAVHCWGGNDFGQLGDGAKLGVMTIPPRRTPGPAVDLGQPAIRLVPGVHGTCAVLADRSVRCWGRNQFGQLGDGTRQDRSEPVLVLQLGPVKALSAGLGHACALEDSGALSCWGDNAQGELGRPIGQASAVPLPVSDLPTVVDVVAGFDSTCVVLSDGTLSCWGYNEAGQLGDGTLTSRHEPKAVTAVTSVKRLVSGGLSNYAILEDGSVRSWGYNDRGQLGDGSDTNHYTPVPLAW